MWPKVRAFIKWCWVKLRYPNKPPDDGGEGPKMPGVYEWL